MKKVILTGLRPTGNLHLGHYFGAGKTWRDVQDDYDFYLEIADVQALTDNFNDPEKVRRNVYEITKDLLSIGLDPNKVNFFIQSKIPEIAELTVFYSNLVTVSRLQRNPTVKTEIAQKKELFGNSGESITYGFLGYPVSQAADITAFKGEVVPVGEDQLPLLEQCREIVRKFNSIYGETLIEPDHLLSTAPRVKGLDGSEKMGKSLGNAIFVVDDDETISKFLSSDKDEEILMALDIIKTRDIFAFLPEISKILLNHPRETIKSYTLMLLVKKELDRNLKINKLGEIKEINPKYLNPPFTGAIFNEIVRYFDHEFKDLTLSQTAAQLLSQYCIYIYPAELDKSPKLYALAFYLIASEYAGSPIEEVDAQELAVKEDIKIEELDSLIESIKKVLQDF